ncbi:MAG: GAF domain-containing protein, partial [Vulcanimicrobiota bacterium]
MVDTAEFEHDLLARIVQNIKPSRAAIFSGADFQLSVSHGLETDETEFNLELIQKVVESAGPVSDKVQKRQLAAPYKNTEGEILGIMYVEIAPPRRLKFRDLAILQGLGRQMVERHWQSSGAEEKSLTNELMQEVTRYVRSTLSIVSSVLKPQRVMILVRLEGEPRIMASRGFPEVQDLASVPFSLELVNAVWEKGETTHIRDALNEPEYSALAGVEEHSIRSVCVCPLNKLDGEDRGLIYLDSCKDPAEFLSAEVSILQRLALALEKDLAKVLAPDTDSGELLESPGISSLDNENEYSLTETEEEDPVEAVRALAVDSTVEVPPEIATRALAGALETPEPEPEP